MYVYMCAWSIPCVLKISSRKYFCYIFSGKKVRFSYGNLRISRITNFKNRSFSSAQGVVQIESNSLCNIPYVLRLKIKKSFCYSLSRKKVSFSYVNFRLIRIINFK